LFPAVPSFSALLANPIEHQIDEALQQNKLKNAVKLLQENPKNIELTKPRWNAIFRAIEETTAQADDNTENLRAEFPLQSVARTSMTDLYTVLKEQGQLRLFGAVDTRQFSPAAGSHTLPPALLESILDLPMTALTPKPTNSLLLAGIALAVVEGIVSASSGLSLNLLTFATLLAFAIDRLFLNGALFETVFKILQPGLQSKILRHEAGHLLAAYLLGCPVEGIVLSAWAALQDSRFGTRQVSAGTSFFDPDLSAQINGNGLLTRSALDRYSIIVMAGIAAEADIYGEADGGAGDEMALVAFLSRLNGGRVGIWDSDNIRNQARWGALNAVLMIREYKPAYDALVYALECGGTLGDCIYAIEKAARDHNLQPLQQPIGYIENKKWTTERPSYFQVSAPEPVSSTVISAGSKTEPTDGTMESSSVDQSEASLSRLSGYRAELEKRLETVERQLKDLEVGQ
jgi:hypothetical protein